MTRDIGLDVQPPEETCDDPNCPFHGTLPVRGQVFSGIVVKDKMTRSVVVRRILERDVPKYERREKRKSSIAAHSPPCLKVKAGDRVKIAECRPLSKTKSFVVVEVTR